MVGAPDYERLAAQAAADGRISVVGALILNAQGRVFVHRRGPERRFLPGGWDVVGGHVQPGETLLEGLARELEEETGWRLSGTPQLVYVGDWTLPGDEPSPHREFDFLVEVDGDLDAPRLEWPKHTELRWIGADELDLLDENRGADDGIVRQLVEIGLRSAHPGTLTTPHVGLFITGPLAERIGALRWEWDPALASQIAAHVTVAYPSEVPDLDELLRRARQAGSLSPPVRLELVQPMIHDRPEDGVFLNVRDSDGAWRKLRRSITGADTPAEPHLTLVHPRTSNRGPAAWQALRTLPLSGDLTVPELAVTAFDSRRWQVVERVPLIG
jgi:8-oxo-dGTP diphosphatase